MRRCWGRDPAERRVDTLSWGQRHDDGWRFRRRTRTDSVGPPRQHRCFAPCSAVTSCCITNDNGHRKTGARWRKSMERGLDGAAAAGLRKARSGHLSHQPTRGRQIMVVSRLVAPLVRFRSHFVQSVTRRLATKPLGMDSGADLVISDQAVAHRHQHRLVLEVVLSLRWMLRRWKFTVLADGEDLPAAQADCRRVSGAGCPTRAASGWEFRRLPPPGPADAARILRTARS